MFILFNYYFFSLMCSITVCKTADFAVALVRAIRFLHSVIWLEFLLLTESTNEPKGIFEQLI